MLTEKLLRCEKSFISRILLPQT